jgi:hypothetical protein
MVLWLNKVYKGPNESLVVQPVVNDSVYNLLEENKCSSGIGCSLHLTCSSWCLALLNIVSLLGGRELAKELAKIKEKGLALSSSWVPGCPGSRGMRVCLRETLQCPYYT